MALKYSAAKLHEKGILLSIDGLPSNQFKNIQFEIVPVIAPVPGSSSSADQHHEQQVKQPALGNGTLSIFERQRSRRNTCKDHIPMHNSWDDVM